VAGLADGEASRLQRVADALIRHLQDVHGFQGLRLELTTRAGERLAYRILPAPYGESRTATAGSRGAPATALRGDVRLRVIPLTDDGRPRSTGARRLNLAEVESLLRETLQRDASGWAVSVAGTTGLQAWFGPDSVKIRFQPAAEAAPLVPVGHPAAAPPPVACAPRPAAPASSNEILPADEARPLLEGLDMAGPDGRLRRDELRKWNQIVHFLRLLEGPLARLPSGRRLLVVDCGCGKSQLLFALNYWLTYRQGRQALFIGLDAEPRAVAAARRLQDRLGWSNMEFVQSEIQAWVPPGPPDIVLSLHACDTATDQAIALGLKAGSKVIVAVPCCQHELARQVKHEKLDGILARHPILLNRFGDWLTDGLRVLAMEAFGYSVDVLEFVSPLDTPKNIMLRAVKTRGPDRRAFERYREMCGYFGVSPALDRLLAGAWPAEAASPK